MRARVYSWSIKRVCQKLRHGWTNRKNERYTPRAAPPPPPPAALSRSAQARSPAPRAGRPAAAPAHAGWGCAPCAGGGTTRIRIAIHSSLSLTVVRRAQRVTSLPRSRRGGAAHEPRRPPGTRRAGPQPPHALQRNHAWRRPTCPPLTYYGAYLGSDRHAHATYTYDKVGTGVSRQPSSQASARALRLRSAACGRFRFGVRAARTGSWSPA